MGLVQSWRVGMTSIYCVFPLFENHIFFQVLDLRSFWYMHISVKPAVFKF